MGPSDETGPNEQSLIYIVLPFRPFCFVHVGDIICEAPNNVLSKFEGTLSMEGDQKLPLSNDQMLLRGCVLRNTKCCYGLVVFAGQDTKLMKNSGQAVFKRTHTDRLLNTLIIGVSIRIVQSGV